MKPIRIQMQRTKGWRKPENTVVVARPSRWGNPFKVHDYRTAEEAVRLFRCEIPEFTKESARRELAGKNLACWCAVGSPCHGDVLLEIANAPVIELVPPGPWICPRQPDNEPCDCPECQRRMLT